MCIGTRDWSINFQTGIQGSTRQVKAKLIKLQTVLRMKSKQGACKAKEKNEGRQLKLSHFISATELQYSIFLTNFFTCRCMSCVCVHVCECVCVCVHSKKELSY